MKLLTRLQTTIESIYRIDGSPPVEDFRVDAGQVIELFGAKARPNREALLVSQDGEHTDVGLFVDEDIANAAHRFLSERENSDDLDSFCAALEGVSHFVYFMYCGLAQSRPVSLLELELQAEVDKYLLLRLFYPHEGLFDRLFVGFQLDDGLDGEAAERYRRASAEASRYARWIDQRIERGETVRVIADARALYRKTFADKLEHIARAA